MTSNLNRENQNERGASMLPFRWYPLLTRLFGKLKASQDPQVLFEENIEMSPEMQRQFGHFRANFFELYNKLEESGRVRTDPANGGLTAKLRIIFFESFLLFGIGLVLYFLIGASRGTVFYDVSFVLILMGGVNILLCCLKSANLIGTPNMPVLPSDELFHRIYHHGFVSGVSASSPLDGEVVVVGRQTATGG